MIIIVFIELMLCFICHAITISIDCFSLGDSHFKETAFHSTVVIRENLYCWGGDQQDLPAVHDNEQKRKVTQFVSIFYIPKCKWDKRSTTGTPPAGIREYACTNLRTNILYFGGSCKPRDCFHNDLLELNTFIHNWREVFSSIDDNKPIPKRGCGIITFTSNAEDHVLVLGGFGLTPVSVQAHSEYIPNLSNPNHCYTNELHMMCLSLSPGITSLTLPM